MPIFPGFDTITSLPDFILQKHRDANEDFVDENDFNTAPDGRLIKLYVAQGNQHALETLIRRHYDISYKRFLKHMRNRENAEDLTQQLWKQIISTLATYKDDGKFPEFLMRCATNLMRDFWRRKGVKDKVIHDHIENNTDHPVDYAADAQADTLKTNEVQEQIDLLTTKLIPELPCDQRLAFLLKHESEYWEYKQRLDWRHLAALNGFDEQRAWELFERTRNALLENHSQNQSADPLSCEANLIFIVWTQAQRPFKNHEFTWAYFSKILNIPENTLKTRYRAALQSLADGLKNGAQL